LKRTHVALAPLIGRSLDMVADDLAARPVFIGILMCARCVCFRRDEAEASMKRCQFGILFL
jgi:hypothetical protein